MSIEFVEPDETVAAPPPVPAARPSAVAGRVLGVVALVAALLAGLAVTVPLYVVERTAFVVDFDGTTTQDARIPYDAFGDPSTVPLVTASSPGASPVLSVSLTHGVDYGRWWIGIAVVLLLVGGWSLVRPRSSAPAAVVAALGGVLLGSLGAAWLTIRTVDATSVPQIRFEAHPDAGVWLLTTAGALALLAGLLHAGRPPLRRLLRRRQRPV